MSLTVTPPVLSLRIFAVVGLLVALNGCVNMDDAAGLSKLSDDARRLFRRFRMTSRGLALGKTLSSKTRRRRSARRIRRRSIANRTRISRTRLRRIRTFCWITSTRSASSRRTSHWLRCVDRYKCDEYERDSGISTSAAAAANDAQSILKALADAATKGYREKELDQLIKGQRSGCRTLTQALKKIVLVTRHHAL